MDTPMSVQLGAKPIADPQDLSDPSEIAEMVRRFYADVAQDDLLGPVFEDVAQVDWSAHLPKLTAFWCRALLQLPGYEGNPFREHQRVNDLSAFTTAHFERWLQLFEDTLRVGWSGPNVERALDLAHRVAEVHCRQIVGVDLQLESVVPRAAGVAPYH